MNSSDDEDLLNEVPTKEAGLDNRMTCLHPYKQHVKIHGVQHGPMTILCVLHILHRTPSRLRRV